MLKKIIMFLLVPFLLFASNDGGQQGAFIRLGIGANALGLGKAYTAISKDADAVYWNASALAFTEKKQVNAMISKPFSEFDDINYNFIGYTMPLNDNSAIGLGMIYLNVDNIEKRSSSGLLQGSFTDKEYAVYGTYSYKLLKDLSLGCSLKYVYYEIDVKSSSLFSFDLSSKYLLNDKTNIGVVIENIYSSDMQLDVEKEKLPVSFRSGISYKILSNWMVSGDIIYLERTDIKYAIGTEVKLLNKLSLRMGYDGTAEDFSCGLGFKVKNTKLDYSWTTQTDLGDSHRFSINYAF